MTKYVYDFHEGNKDMKDLLGGKGANLAEMTNMGLPVPHGFTITTEACLTYLAEGTHPAGLIDELEDHLKGLEDSMGKRLGDASDPLLVSVRSGARFSMPGMMDTVLNLGLNEDSLKGLVEQTGGDVRFANDAYRRFVQMFGKIVMDIPGDAFEHALDAAKQRKGPNAQDTDLDADDLRGLIEEFRDIYQQHTGSEFPTDPREQLRLAVEAVFQSWNGRRARDYRRQNKISDDLGTAVNATSPTAAPGDALRPFATASYVASGSNCGCSSWSSCSGRTRRTASRLSMRPSSTISVAIRSAAAAVRLPTRVWSMNRRPCSIVNSMSHMSR